MSIDAGILNFWRENQHIDMSYVVGNYSTGGT